MSSSKDLQCLWWPNFENLYEGLREASASASSVAHANLAHVLQDVQVWLQMGLQGFQPPAHDARSFLEKESHWSVANGKKVPIKAELRSAAVLLSHHLGLNELQAYLLLYRLPALQQAGSTQKLSLEQLHDLQHAYFLQRSYLLSSIHELLSQQDSAEVYQRSATTALSHALDAGLDKSLCRALAMNLAEGRSDTSDDTSAISAGMSSALILSNSQHSGTQSQRGNQQLLLEREMLLSTLLCMFADWKPCTPDCFQQLMHAMHQHMCFSWHTDKESGAVTSKALQLMQTLSVQFMTIPALFSTLGQGSLPSSDKAPLLVSGQDRLCQVFTTWLDSARQTQHGAAGLTAGHGPAMLAFAAAAALLKDMPDFSGPLADIDPTTYANKAAQLEVLPTLAELTSSGQLSQASRITLLSLMCAAIAAFDLSPYTLSARQLQAVIDTLANLYEGQEELCAAFHDASKPDHFWHAPVRQFYQQTLELLFEDPKPVLRLWHSLACGLQSSDAVANMLENCVPPVMRVTGSEKLSWQDENRNTVQAVEDMAIPNSAGLTVSKGTTGRVLQKAQYLVEMEHAKHTKSHPLLASDSTFLVLWLPSTYQRHSKQKSRAGSGDTEDRHLRPGNDIVLGQAWACLHRIQQASRLQCSEALTELLLIIKLFVRLAESRASIGHDLMRVKQVGKQCETQAGADVLDLACQVTDALCRMQRPSVELLGACIGLKSALARAFPGYAATLASKTYLLGEGDSRSHKAGPLHAPLTSHTMPMLEHVQRVWEGAQGAYPVTLAFLGLTETLLIAGVNEACLKSYVGFTLSHILSSCHSWRYAKRSQRWDITTAALQVLQAAMTSPLIPQARPESKDPTQPDWCVAQAVAEAVSNPGHPAVYLFINLPPHADFLDTLVKRQGREAEAASLETMTAQWLLLTPLLVQACKRLPYPSAFLQDLFQAPAEGKISAAHILASYIAYPFEEVEGLSLGAIALEAGQALAVAASAVSQGQVSLARCLLQGSAGDAATCPVLEALARCFRHGQAVENPLAFSAAAELLVTAFTAPHPSLLVLLMTGSSVDEANDKENSSQLGNLAAGANKALPSAKKASKKDSRPTCLDGLWEILQHAEELLQSQPDVMAHTLRLLAVMWQSGEIAAMPTAMLRSQPEFLKLVAACIQPSGPKRPDITSDTTKSDGERVNDLVDVWQQNVSMAWCLVAESHALTILAVEAFAQPRQQGTASQADVWTLLDKWGSNKDAKGVLGASLERYTAPLWGPVASQALGLSQASILTQELYLEAETKLVFMFAFMAYFEADDLAKHTSGHTLLAALWQKVSPLLVAHCRNQGLDPAVSMQVVLEDLGQALVKREPSSADWKELEASACQYRDLVSLGDDAQLRFHGDAQMVLLLHDIRQLHLTDAFLQAGAAHHCSTLSRVYGDNYLYDEVQFEDLVGELMVQRTGTGTLQDMLRACSVMASVQDAQVHAMQALSTLATIMARSSPAVHPPALPTADASHTLTCLEIALSPLLVAATRVGNQPTFWAAAGLDTRAAHYAIAQSTAQIMHSQLRHWKPKQAPSQPLPASAVTSDKQHRPPKPKSLPLRLAQMSSASCSDSHEDGGWQAQLAVAEQLLSIARSWLVYQRTAAPLTLDTTSSEPITQSLLSSLLLVLRRIGLTSLSSPPPHAHHQSHPALYAAARDLLPELCQMAASLGCHAGLAASLIPVMMRSCHLSPSGSIPLISKHLHLVQAMYHAFHVGSVALIHHSQAQQAQVASEATPGAMAENFESANADLEGTLEGSLLAMALHLAQDAPGAQMLLDQGVADFLPALAKWLLSPDSADLLAAAVTLEQGTAQESGATSGRCGGAELAGMYNRHGHHSPAHQQWCALLSLSGALVRSIERDDRLDKGIVTLLVVAQERMLAVLTSPDSAARQPLTLALLQEVEKVLFLASSVPHMKGQWQMATQGPSQGPGPGSMGGPLAMRQASCVFLEFAALAVNHHHQPPCCPPISPYEKSLASTSPQLPIAEAWFKATAVGSAPQEQPLQWQDPQGSMNQAPVSATGYSCQVAETMYSCVMLALKLLKAFCPEAGPHQFSQIGLGWPSPAVLKALQKQCHAMAHSHIPEGSRRAISLVRSIQGSLKSSWLLLRMLPAQIEDNEQKDYSVTSHKLQSMLDKQ